MNAWLAGGSYGTNRVRCASQVIVRENVRNTANTNTCGRAPSVVRELRDTDDHLLSAWLRHSSG